MVKGLVPSPAVSTLPIAGREEIRTRHTVSFELDPCIRLHEVILGEPYRRTFAPGRHASRPEETMVYSTHTTVVYILKVMQIMQITHRSKK